MQKRDLFNTRACFLYYWQICSTVVCHHLADIFLSATRLVREIIVKHTAREPISLHSEIEPNHSKKILHVPSFQKTAGFGRSLGSAIWYDSTLTPHTSKKRRSVTLMCGCKYLSLLPTEELLEVTELYFISKIIIYAWKKHRKLRYRINATSQHRQLNSSVWFHIPWRRRGTLCLFKPLGH